ncbi:DNA adenine methylase [Xenorhabdus cabanillasii]|uniref:site-specific DNA-methyltransferase (adenine-specific) n=1 Tax=Xenorhabdus cabanillasii TaxID=351673 RepID=A0A3D9UF01_9GAMM|nr:DNA adenine methylase [Xenorhabdus cabanillasii]REF27969.1 DNA adenine methylase [Xenorhabdus cabanillasii]
MKPTYSPLRYPGGKSAISEMVSSLITYNDLNSHSYAEPYAGGAGLALSLLFSNKVKSIYLNDIDRSIWSFWNAILTDSERFIKKIISTDITIDEWHKQRDIQHNKEQADIFDLAFSTFFLNRTNRSGIIFKAGVIGGFSQSGKYKLDCRFNKKGLVDRINRIAQKKDKIHVYNMDAIDFMSKIKRKKILLSIDPPYYEKGSSLYTNFYQKDDHCNLSKNILKLKKPWILTYDFAYEIYDLYKEKKCFSFDLNYSAAHKRIGKELLVISDGISIPDSLKNSVSELNQSDFF